MIQGWIKISCTRTMLYAYWSSECQSKRAPAWRENAFFNCVLDRTETDTVGTVRRSEKMKEFSEEAEGRPKGSVEPGERWTHKFSKSQSKLWESSAQSVQFNKESMILLFNSTILQGDCHFVEEFFKSEPRMNSNQIQPSHRGTEK